LTAATYLNGGLGRHTAEALQRILSSSTLNLSFFCGSDAFSFNGHASSASLERLMELLSANLTDPGWTQEAAALATTQLSAHYYNLAYTPEGVLGRNVFRTLSGGDSRYTSPTVEQFKSRTLDEAKQWLGPQLASAPLEVGLVGDFDVEQTVELLSRTVGALPARDGVIAIERPLKFAKVASAHRFKFQGEARRAGLQIVWPVDGCRDPKFSRQTEVMTAIFESRLTQKVREDLGAAYSPSVSFWKSDVNLNDGYIMAYISVKRGQAKRISRLMIEIADSLSRAGVTADEFEQARTPILARATVEQKENGYWLRHIIPRAQSNPDVREWPLTRLRDLQAMTAADINAVARTMLSASHAITFSAVPGRK
jgi:zinc protease